MKKSFAIAALLLASALGVSAFAADPGLAEMPQARDSCVTLPEGSPAMPEYPKEAYEAKRGGTVRLEMEFVDSRSSPRVKVVTKPDSQSGELLARSAKEFALSYRNTCIKPGDAPVRVQQEFSFVPNDGRKVAWTIPSTFPESGAENKGLDCVKHEGRDNKPEFPFAALRAGVSTRVVVRALFTELGKEPEITFPVPGAHPAFTESVRRYARGYRVTCGNLPLAAIQTFDFHIEGEQFFVLRDTNLKSFLGATKNATARPVFFDLDAMACPFDVRVRYWQPYFRNQVGEVGESRPERRVFLDWLADLELNIGKGSAAQVAGTELTITVPCGKIDL